jgi:type I restriction enzyme S subunit
MTQLKNATLRDVCTLVTDGTHDTPKTLDSGAPFIKAKQINDGIIEFSDCEFISHEDHLKVISRSKPEKGDTLFAHIGASLGEAAYINTNLEFSIKNIALFKPDPKKINPRYLYYLVINNEFQDGIKNRRTGSAQPFVSLDILRTNPIRFIEDIPTQRRIAEMLSAYDDLIENNKRRIRILEQMSQAIYQEWFGKVNKESLPKGWELSTLANHISVDRGVSHKGEHMKGDGLPLLNLKSFSINGGYRTDGLKSYSGEYKSKHVVHAGDIVLANTDLTQAGSIVGNPVIVPNIEGEILFTHHLYAIRFRPNSYLMKYYLYHLLLDNSYKSFAKGRAIGTTVLGLAQDGVLDFEFIRPPKNLIEKFDEIVLPIYKLKDSLEEKNANLRQTRDLLLPRLVSGEIELK